MVYDERRGVTVMVGGTANPSDPLSYPTQSETWELRPVLAMFKPLPAQLESCQTEPSLLLSPPLTLTVEAASPGGVTYTWRHHRDGVIRLDEPTAAPTRLLSGSLNYGTWDVVLTDLCGNSITSSPCVVKIFSAPTIREQPASRRVCPGDPIEIRVVPGPDSLNRLAEPGSATGPERPIRYQWFRLGVEPSGNYPDASASDAVPGAVGSTLRFDSFQPADNGFYRCRLSNDCGDTFTTPVELTAGVWIKRHPVTTTNLVCTLVSIDLLASGKGPLSYQWRRNGDPLPTNVLRVSGGTTPSLTFASLRYLDDAAYDCIVADACNSVTSRVAGIGVLPNPLFLLVETNGPSGRERHAMVYDSVRGVSVLFGGQGAGRTVSEAVRNDTWEYDGAKWARRFPANSPSSRVDFGLAFDRHRGRVVLFGGMTNDAFRGGYPSGETWEYDGTSWTQRFPRHRSRPAPQPRALLRSRPAGDHALRRRHAPGQSAGRGRVDLGRHELDAPGNYRRSPPVREPLWQSDPAADGLGRPPWLRRAPAPAEQHSGR